MCDLPLPDPLCRALRRPDFAPLAAGARMAFAPDLAEPWQLRADGALLFGPDSLGAEAAAELRHALELRLLRPLFGGLRAAAGLAAARTAALFAGLERPGARGAGCPGWTNLARCGPEAAAAHWPALAGRQSGAPARPCAADEDALRRTWALLGPAEYLLQIGGDQRLRTDPQTGLNAYGAGARPRPWAVTFASSTASSPSERGYAAAEVARIRLLRAALLEGDGPALRQEAASVRTAIAGWYGVGAGQVVLAASGTDCELLALAVVQLGSGGRPITNILVSPGETGRGVTLAAAGRHFAPDTARGCAVEAGTLADGFRPDTSVQAVALRGPDGSPISGEAVAAACGAAVERAVAGGGHALLHVLDVSKTGLMGPAPELAAAILERFAGRADVVVDANQARLSPARVRDYLARGWMVMVTGSKFFTGPPFCGALLLPETLAARLARGALPAGLGGYSARADWPDCAAARALPGGVNAGLLLRWRAALAEMDAFAAVPDATRHAILARFLAAVRRGVAEHPELILLEAPHLELPQAEPWERLCSIVSFAVRDSATGLRMDEAAARDVHGWLNADLSGALGAGPCQGGLARRRLHIGQPVGLAGPDGIMFGALRLSAGARLVSGEPSHAGLGLEKRVEREIADALAVLDKVGLILRHWARLQALRPAARYA